MDGQSAFTMVGGIVSLPGVTLAGWEEALTEESQAMSRPLSISTAPEPRAFPGGQLVPVVEALDIRATVLLGRLPGLTCASFSWTLSIEVPRAQSRGPKWAVDTLVTLRTELSDRGLLWFQSGACPLGGRDGLCCQGLPTCVPIRCLHSGPCWSRSRRRNVRSL